MLLLLFCRRSASLVFQAGRWLSLGGIGTNCLGWAAFGKAVDYLWLGADAVTNAADLATVVGLAMYAASVLRKT